MEKKYNPERDGGLNREDAGAESRPKKSKGQDEESFVSSFSRDKRPRIRRVTEQLNERTPQPHKDRGDEPFKRDDRAAGALSPFRQDNREGSERRSFERRPESREGDERRPYKRDDPEGENSSPYKRDDREGGEHRSFERRPDNRERSRSSSGAGNENRPRASYNPNFDAENRLRRPAPRGDRREEPSEEDNRFNSYNYDRGSRDNNRENSRDNNRGFQPRENRPRFNGDRPQQDNRPGFNRDNRYNNNRGPQSGDSRYKRDGDREDRRYPSRDNRAGRPDNDRKTYPRDNNRPGSKRPSDPFKTPKGGYDSEYKPTVYPAYSAANIDKPIRLNKFISMSGLCSRREADEYISKGQITVNGVVITEMGVKVNPGDIISFNGEQLQGEKRVYILMNKPKGFVTTVEDPNADRTVMDIVKNACKERVYPVGRLDKNSLGVLLITNDGELTKKLTHPSHEKKKIYQITLDRPASREELAKLLDGVELEDGLAVADEVEILDPKGREIGIVIHTGRNRIVRRMFEALGYHVQKLDRVYFAGLTKKTLRRGAWRYLTPKEVAVLKSGNYE